MILDELSTKYGTDKAAHRYTPIYEEYFSNKRESIKRVCEIGAYKGASVHMWKEYFINADIIGVDIAPRCKDEERISIIIADQSNEESLKNLSTIIGNDIDIIIDDGSHYSEHQALTFKYLFPCLKDGGVYIVEDIYPLKYGCKFLDLCLELVKGKFVWPSEVPLIMRRRYPMNPALMDYPSISWIDKNVIKIDIRRSIVFITKGNVGGGSM